MNWSGLISDDGENASAGKVMLWILLIVSVIFWFLQWKFPETLYYFFSFIVMYNFGKKGLNVVTDMVPLLKQAQAPEAKEGTK